MTDAEEDHVEPPFSPPGCRWLQMTPDSPIPEDAVYLNGELDGERVYVGRVYERKCIFVGTAIPKKSVCIYLNDNLDLKSSLKYEILAVTENHGDPLWFVPAKSTDHNFFTSGLSADGEVLYACRHIDDKYNTFYGWIHDVTKKAYIPRDSDRGSQVLDDGFDVLVHRYLHMMCTGCPMPVKGVNYF